MRHRTAPADGETLGDWFQHKPTFLPRRWSGFSWSLVAAQHSQPCLYACRPHRSVPVPGPEAGMWVTFIPNSGPLKPANSSIDRMVTFQGSTLGGAKKTSRATPSHLLRCGGCSHKQLRIRTCRTAQDRMFLVHRKCWRCSQLRDKYQSRQHDRTGRSDYSRKRQPRSRSP